MKDRSTSLSKGREPIFGESDINVPLKAFPEAVDPATGAATGFALAEIPEIPILPVRESSNPPTEGDEAVTTSGSIASPSIMSPIACATINALIQKFNEDQLALEFLQVICFQRSKLALNWKTLWEKS